MKKLFFYLLKKYSKTEKDRIKILKTIHESISEEFSEQTPPGTLYFSYEELLKANPLINKVIIEGDIDFLIMIERGLKNTFNDLTDELFDKICLKK